MTKRCKSCDAEIEWATTPDGKKVPLDAKEVLVAIETDAGFVEFKKARVSHFATCPDAAAHRKPRPRRETREAPRNAPRACAMCEQPTYVGKPGSTLVGKDILCSNNCKAAYRARQSLDRLANAERDNQTRGRR